jgi:tetratricopeptide (TPR) repeat protein
MMSWKCVCKEENNPDESKICKNCGRSRPKYLGVQLNTTSSEKMSTDQKAVWYLLIAQDHIHESDEYLELDRDLTEKLGDSDQSTIASQTLEYKSEVEKNCSKCLTVLNMTEELSPEVQFENDDGFVLNIPAIKSNAYFNLGTVYFRKEDYAKAIEYYQKSYDADPNQVSIYNIAMATINLPAEGGGLFGGKKKQVAQEAKQEQEAELLKKTIKFAPFTELGIKSGRMLMEQYGITEFDI